MLPRYFIKTYHAGRCRGHPKIEECSGHRIGGVCAYHRHVGFSKGPHRRRWVGQWEKPWWWGALGDVWSTANQNIAPPKMINRRSNFSLPSTMRGHQHALSPSLMRRHDVLSPGHMSFLNENGRNDPKRWQAAMEGQCCRYKSFCLPGSENLPRQPDGLRQPQAGSAARTPAHFKWVIIQLYQRVKAASKC